MTAALGPLLLSVHASIDALFCRLGPARWIARRIEGLRTTDKNCEDNGQAERRRTMETPDDLTPEGLIGAVARPSHFLLESGHHGNL